MSETMTPKWSHSVDGLRARVRTARKHASRIDRGGNHRIYGLRAEGAADALEEVAIPIAEERDRLRTKLVNAGESWSRCMEERDQMRAERDEARAERDEARRLLESIPTWGPYHWLDVPDTVRRKLRGNDDQIVSLMRERDAARTILDGEIRARTERERERDEARRMLGECYVLSGADTDGNPPESVHVWPGAVEAVRELREDYDEVCEEAHGPDGFVKQIDTLTAERDRLARIPAVECGDEDPPGEWLRDTTDPRWTVFVHPGDARVMQWGTLSWRWDGGTAGGFGWGKSALEAMEAADKIREP